MDDIIIMFMIYIVVHTLKCNFTKQQQIIKTRNVTLYDKLFVFCGFLNYHIHIPG